jgi:hypothetical protein
MPKQVGRGSSQTAQRLRFGSVRRGSWRALNALALFADTVLYNLLGAQDDGVQVQGAGAGAGAGEDSEASGTSQDRSATEEGLFVDW